MFTVIFRRYDGQEIIVGEHLTHTQAADRAETYAIMATKGESVTICPED